MFYSSPRSVICISPSWKNFRISRAKCWQGFCVSAKPRLMITTETSSARAKAVRELTLGPERSAACGHWRSAWASQAATGLGAHACTRLWAPVPCRPRRGLRHTVTYETQRVPVTGRRFADGTGIRTPRVRLYSPPSPNNSPPGGSVFGRRRPACVRAGEGVSRAHGGASGPVRGSAGHTGALSRVQDSEPRPALGLCWLQGLCITFFLR